MRGLGPRAAESLCGPRPMLGGPVAREHSRFASSFPYGKCGQAVFYIPEALQFIPVLIATGIA